MSDAPASPTRRLLNWGAQVLPQAWQQQAGWLWLLWPLSQGYRGLMALRRWAYRQGWLTPWRAPVPVLVIGNITVGGSGKTPLIITLVHALQQQGIAVGVISRGYGGAGPFPLQVTADTPARDCGDEPRLIVDSTGVPMAVGADRAAVITALLAAHPQLQLILSDDGLQHWALARDLEWIVLDQGRGLGNGQLLPMGFLREPVQRLQHATVIGHGGTGALRMELQPQPLQPVLPQRATQPLPQAGQAVHAVAGIAHPQRFFNTVRQLGFKPIEHAFADHHAYQRTELQFLPELPRLTTAKDAVKWKELGVQGWVVPVQAALSREVWQCLAEQLAGLGLTFDAQAVSTAWILGEQSS